VCDKKEGKSVQFRTDSVSAFNAHLLLEHPEFMDGRPHEKKSRLRQLRENPS
jgi:hypothetical protein